MHLRPLIDSRLDRLGFALDHPYLERVYLSVLGPTSVALLRHAGRLFDEHPDGVDVDLTLLSTQLGLGHRGGDRPGPQSPIRRTLERITQFNLAVWLSDDHLGIRRKIAPLSRGRVQRLPEPLQTIHDRLVTEHLATLAGPAKPRAVLANTAGRLLPRTTEPRTLTR